ncbi:DNA-binding response regulator [Gemmatimonadetes bacterium T265]|nr:DNA-binding response regulator [Gemmatimonadetes bacterium T265]
MTAPPIRVLVCDDHAVVREGIRHVLAGEPGFEVVAEAANGEQALTLAAAHRPDVVVLDVTMPGESGLRVAPKLRAAVPGTRVLILSMHDNAEYVREGVRAGASGYLLKDSAAAELRLAVRAVHAGGTYFSTPAALGLSGMSAPPAGGAERADGADGAGDAPHATGAPPLGVLTARERDVLDGIARGATNKEIAAELGISHRTVETHRESLMRKLGIRTVAGLTRYVLDAGGAVRRDA